MTIDTNVDTTTPTEHLDTGHVEDAPIDGVSRLKKSKRASSHNVPKRGSLVDGDTSSPTKLSIYNDSSDNVAESTDVPLEQTDGANDVPNNVNNTTWNLKNFATKFSDYELNNVGCHITP